jgi:hypothetical protein
MLHAIVVVRRVAPNLQRSRVAYSKGTPHFVERNFTLTD